MALYGGMEIGSCSVQDSQGRFDRDDASKGKPEGIGAKSPGGMAMTEHSKSESRLAGTIMAIAWVLLAACQPTVKVEAPDKPIVINLNVKIEQEVRVKVDREVEDLLKAQPDIF